MLQSTEFLVFLWILQGTFSAVQKCRDPCSCSFNDPDETYINLGTVGRSDGMARYFLLGKNEKGDSVLYAFNPCHPISYSTKEFEVYQHACSGVAVCMITPGSSNDGTPTQEAIGYQTDAEFFLDEGHNPKINYSFPGDPRKTLTVTLSCNHTESLEIQNEKSFILSTSCACQHEEDREKCRTASPGSKKGLSTGSILLITFFVILLVYVVFGILFNFCKGAHGTELLPNFEFWNELPKLIVDGFLFTCSCFGRRSSYADV